MSRAILLAIGLTVISISVAATARGDEPGWSASIVSFGRQRAEFSATPILNRPYRPLHFYGNTLRRRHFRGIAAPLPRDVSAASRAVVSRR